MIGPQLPGPRHKPAKVYPLGGVRRLAERFEILEFVTGWDGERTGAEIIQLGAETPSIRPV